MRLQAGPRRGRIIDITEEEPLAPRASAELAHYEELDLLYRSLCAVLYNYVPTSGHPGGSISSGRLAQVILFESMDYDCGQPRRDDADMVSYAAGHKALGLYALWALRHEILRLGAPELLPADSRQHLRLEDLLGFRRNPTQGTPLFQRFRARALDGHPTPATPFLKVATGASGVGMASSLGLALAAQDLYGADAPRVHIIEGEGGLTPGRVAEALAAAGTASLHNVLVHVDWNQSSIDSNRVCREGDEPGDYVQWDPMELFHFHDWNVIEVREGRNFEHIFAAQQRALTLESTQPTALVYRTVKGWQYGIEGRTSHGAGHPLCSDGFYQALSPVLGPNHESLPSCCELESVRCSGPDGAAVMEECFWSALSLLRSELERRETMVQFLADRLHQAKRRLEERNRKPRFGAPRLHRAFDLVESSATEVPRELRLAPGKQTTLRAELGRVLNHLNKASQGAFLVSAADLLDSTSVSKVAEGFPPGYFNAASNPEARRLAIGGICEDAMAGVAAGLSSFGHHVGVASSYAAFITPLGHIAARLHAIGNQAQQAATGEPYRPMILVCAHAGLKTGEDGPTHADPQALQLLQGNFPARTCITLTPWDPQEMWPLVATAMARRPAVIAPFVTRPPESVPDRAALRLAPATAACSGVYALRSTREQSEGTLVLQGSGVAMVFVNEVLPRLDAAGVDLDVYYVASEELFDMLPEVEKQRIFPEHRARQAMGITGFTLPTLYRWVTSDQGRACSLHPYRQGHFLGSGSASGVLREAGLDGEGQYEGIRTYLERRVRV